VLVGSRLVKKPFVLLELLIAFALVSTCILPFLRYPFKHMEKELDCLFNMELDRQARQRLSEIVANIYCNEVEKETLVSTDVKVKQKKEGVKISLPCGISRKYQERVFLYEAKKKVDKNLKEISLVHARVEYRNPKDKRNILASAKVDLIVEFGGQQ